jgi:myo-inositol-1(or 4)-monophosphatase
MIDYQFICKQVIQVSKTAGNYIRKEKNNLSSEHVETKSLHSFVSYVDKTAEKIIVDELKKILPDSGFITEEETETIKSDNFNWIVDPLDGTTNFIHGVEPYAVSIALEEKGEMVVGVVYEIGKNECFYAYKNSSAFLNGLEISVSKKINLENSLIATGFPYYDFQKNEQILKVLDYFMRNSRGIRRLGSAATDLAYVACGRFDAFFEYGLSPWDVAAGAFIVKQAGGKIGDFSKGNDYLLGREIIAANNLVYLEFAETIRKYLV